MDIATYRYLRHNEHLLTFVRHNPIWYRYLSRDPKAIGKIEQSAKAFYGQTWPQRLEKLNEQIKVVDMLLSFSNIMKD